MSVYRASAKATVCNILRPGPVVSVSDSKLQLKNEAAEDYGRIWRVISHPPLSGLLWFQKVSAAYLIPQGDGGSGGRD